MNFTYLEQLDDLHQVDLVHSPNVDLNGLLASSRASLSQRNGGRGGTSGGRGTPRSRRRGRPRGTGRRGTRRQVTLLLLLLFQEAVDLHRGCGPAVERGHPSLGCRQKNVVVLTGLLSLQLLLLVMCGAVVVKVVVRRLVLVVYHFR